MRKTTCLAVVVAVALAGCGGGSVRTEGPAATAAQASADLWAQSVFGIYGQNALDSCLAGFHHQFKASNGDPADYASELAQYMCACARGQSELPCPTP
jgi:hypothetical protein